MLENGGQAMTYNKPEVVTLATSIKAIQGLWKRMPHIADSIVGLNKPDFTILAYEADKADE